MYNTHTKIMTNEIIEREDINEKRVNNSYNYIYGYNS